MNESMIPNKDAVEGLLKIDMQRYVNFVMSSSVAPVDIDKWGERSKFVTFVKRAKALDMYKRVLSRFKYPKKVSKLDDGFAALWYFLDASGEKALTKQAFNTMVATVREDDPEALLGTPALGDIFIDIQRTQKGTTLFDVLRIKQDSFDPEEQDPRYARDTLDTIIHAMAADGYVMVQDPSTMVPGLANFIPGMPNGTKYKIKTTIKKLTSGGAWDVLNTILPEGTIPPEADVWIKSPTLPFQRVSDAGVTPEVVKVDVTGIKLGPTQEDALRAHVDAIVRLINRATKLFYDSDKINATKAAKEYRNEILEMRSPDYELSRSWVKYPRNTNVLRALESKGLLTFSIGSRDYYAKIRPEAWALLGVKMPPVPEPLPKGKRLTSKEVAYNAVVEALEKISKEGNVGTFNLDTDNIVVEKTATAKVDSIEFEGSKHDVTLTYPYRVIATVSGHISADYVVGKVIRDVRKLFKTTVEKQAALLVTSPEGIEIVKGSLNRKRVAGLISLDRQRLAGEAVKKCSFAVDGVTADKIETSVKLAYVGGTFGSVSVAFGMTPTKKEANEPALLISFPLTAKIDVKYAKVKLKG